ncbi:transmembrane protein 120B-like [Amphiura filiformis]|uniref:transmembrane protein 120B-like n=1 Tax=Amphiura filiformis TaxID=82378 RepID=UPI003B228F7E
MTDSDSDLSTITDEIKELDKEYGELKKYYQEYQEKLSEVQAMQKKCSSLANHQARKYKQLTENLKRTSSQLPNDSDDNEQQKLKKELKERGKVCTEVFDSLPRTGGALLHVIVGKVSVSLLSKAERWDYKEDYEHFKFYMTIICLLLAIFNTFLLQSSTSEILIRFFDAIMHFLLVWWYCTLVLRESILAHNGSRIRGWWVIHHYLSVVLSGILLIWPESITYQLFRNKFMVFSLYLCGVQLIQYYYQSGCLYRLRALGEKADMYITVEGFQKWMWRGLSFLLPFLFGGYIFQLYNAYFLFQLSFHPDCNEWMVPAASLIFFILFLGNMSTTLRVVIDKLASTKKALAKQNKKKD